MFAAGHPYDTDRLVTLAQLRSTLAQVKQSFPENKDVLVVPDYEVNF